jgi:hypothetical protein
LGDIQLPFCSFSIDTESEEVINRTRVCTFKLCVEKLFELV